MTYKLLASGGVQRLADGACIPEDERNADWSAYQDWLSKGNVPIPASQPPPDPTPADEVEARFTNDRALRALAALLINKLGLTRQQLITFLRNNAT